MTTRQFVDIHDEYNQPWRIFEDDALWPEAKKANDDAKGAPVVWLLNKIAAGRGYGWWSTFKKLDDVELDLERLMPNPGKVRLLDLEVEYSPYELRELLQRFGSYLATLHHMESLIEAQGHALKEGFNNGMKVAMAQTTSKETTVTGKESEILASNEVFKHTKRMQIDHEATLLLVKGWRQSYEQAWSTVSRLMSLVIGEAQLQTNRYT